MIQYAPMPFPPRFSSSGGMEGIISASSSNSGPFVDGDAGVGSQRKAASDVNTSISSEGLCALSARMDDQGEKWSRAAQWRWEGSCWV